MPGTIWLILGLIVGSLAVGGWWLCWMESLLGDKTRPSRRRVAASEARALFDRSN
jgi:hypothetical protein